MNRGPTTTRQYYCTRFLQLSVVIFLFREKWQPDTKTASANPWISPVRYRTARGRHNLSPSASVPADLESIPNRPRWTLSPVPSTPAQIASVPIPVTVHYSMSPSLSPTSNITETCQSPKVCHKTPEMRHFEIEQSSADGAMSADVSQERRLVAMSIGCSTAMTSSGSNSLCLRSDAAASYLFRLQLYCIDYRRITADNQLHLYRGNPSTRCSLPAVLQQDLRENPRYYRGYRGITVVPITVQLSAWYV